MTPVAAERVAAFIDAVEAAFSSGHLVQLRLGGYRGEDAELKSVEGRKVALKAGERLSLVYRYKTRDITKNLSIAEVRDWLGTELGTVFWSARLEATDRTLTLERNGDKVRLSESTAQDRAAPAPAHDKQKVRPVPADRAWLQALGLTNAKGRVLDPAQDKFRQINRMVEIFAPLIQAIPEEKLRSIHDMGAGKGYLTFGLHDHLGDVLGRAVPTIGVEFRKDLVNQGNAIAMASGFDALQFVEGSILDHDAGGASVVIALHACDTATDDAIFKGIEAGAELIAVAPCCHKQVRREMEGGKADSALTDLLQHGIFLERQAEMVTDTLRAQMLELSGYRTRVFEFVSDAHTPKNVLIVAQKDGRVGRDRQAKLDRIGATKAHFGVTRHHLETLLRL
jgi:hypothetical protein